MKKSPENRDFRDVKSVEPGNTNKAPRQENQLKSWFFTFNNFTRPDDIEILETVFKKICYKYIFEVEVGEEGTEHLQGVIFLKNKMRWSEFKLSDKIHWEGTKNNEKAIKYCQKDYQEGKTKEIFFFGMKLKKPLKLISPDRLYQKEILEIISKEPDDRKIHWFYEDIGNVGKSQFTKYLVNKYDAIFIDEGKKADLMNHTLTAYQNDNDLSLFIIDIPRDNFNKVSYKSLEAIKNGMIYSPKYEGGQCLFNSPHIIIFCNYPPETSKLSLDRWDIREIQKDYSSKKIDAY